MLDLNDYHAFKSTSSGGSGGGGRPGGSASNGDGDAGFLGKAVLACAIASII